MNSSTYRYSAESGLNELNSAAEYNLNYINFTQQQFGLTNHGIPAQQQALNVMRHAWQQC
jgi:hypothetical protein